MTYGGNYDDYPAVIVDIIGFLGLKGKTPKWYSYSYSEFSSKKEKNIYGDFRGRLDS